MGSGLSGTSDGQGCTPVCLSWAVWSLSLVSPFCSLHIFSSLPVLLTVSASLWRQHRRGFSRPLCPPDTASSQFVPLCLLAPHSRALCHSSGKRVLTSLLHFWCQLTGPRLLNSLAEHLLGVFLLSCGPGERQDQNKAAQRRCCKLKGLQDPGRLCK